MKNTLHMNPRRAGTLATTRQGQRLRQRNIALSLGAAALLAGAAMFTVAHAQLPAAENYQGVEYVSGGFGSDMSEAFKAAQSNYPLGLTFAAVDEDGGARPYVAEVRVVVKKKGGETVLEVPSAGPYLLARLEPGQYEVDATYQGETQTRQVTIGQNGSAQEVITWKRR